MTARLQSNSAALFPISNASNHSKRSKFQTWRSEASEASVSSISIEDGVEPSVTGENLGIFKHFLENLEIFRDF